MAEVPDKAKAEPKTKTTRTAESESSGSEVGMQKTTRVESAEPRNAQSETATSNRLAAITNAERKAEAAISKLPDEGVRVRHDIGKEELLLKRIEHIRDLLGR